MAYAALASLEQTIEITLNHEMFSISDKQQIISLREYVARLQCFLEEFSEKGRCLEGQIRDVANEAEDVLEYFMMHQSRSSLGLNKSSDLPGLLEMRILNEKIDSSAEELINRLNISNVEQHADSPTAGLVPSYKIIKDIVALVDDLTAIKDRLWADVQKMYLAEDFNEYSTEKALPSSWGLNKGELLPNISMMFLSQLRKRSEKFDSIMEVVKGIQSNNDVEELAYSPTARLAPNHKINDVVGLGDDLMAIKDRLCANSRKLQVIPIVGMGGIGKTTLARNAYDDTLTRDYFHIRAWITVSQDYSRQEILSNLLISMKILNTDGSTNDNDGEKVYKILKGRRYLIVMDDMWSTKAWDHVRNLFPDDNNGSRIVLTSRLLDVAAYPDRLSHPHQMHLMKPDLSWDLLRKKVFLDEDCPSELENIGIEIARNCGGLPLAIVVIAGVLSAVTKTPISWREIAENVKSTFGAKEGHLEKILSLSYSHLPHHLRSCFLYMGGFPEDYKIRVSKLTKLWVAEGFLKKIRSGSKSLEEEATKCLEDLIKRNLVLVNKRKSDFNVKVCSLHDLVRDMCLRKAQEEKFLQYAQNVVPHGIESHRRISVANIGQDCLSKFGSTVRSLKFFQCGSITAGFLGKFKLLRVLDLICVEFSVPNQIIDSLPQPVCELIHLRYLAFMDYVSIPATISNLQNLQTLIICAWKTTRDYPHDSAAVLPSVIWKMPQLRHLVSSFFDPLPDPEDATLSLQNLQTLSQTTNFVCSRRVLGLIPNLQKLGIFYCRGKDDGEYHLENLVHLHQLEKLKIKIYADFAFRQKLNPVFPRTLKKLTLSGFRVPWERITIVGSLPNLEVLKLRDFAYKGSTWETNDGEFSELLIDKSCLQHWITESSHFPSLKSLVLHRCWCLREIPDDIGEIPTLELIEVNGNKSLIESAKRIQDEQQSLGNDSLQVHYLHS